MKKCFRRNAQSVIWRPPPLFFFPFSVVFLADRTSPQNEQVLVFQTTVIWKAQDLSWA